MQQNITLMVGMAGTLALAIPWLIALDDVLRRPEWEFPPYFARRDYDRTIWIAIVLLGNLIGSIAYYFMVMRPYPRRPR